MEAGEKDELLDKQEDTNKKEEGGDDLKQVKVDHTAKYPKDRPRPFINQKSIDKVDSNIAAVNIKSNKSRII